MADYDELSVKGFLDRVADRTPTPGGGSVTAMAGALACALGRMVAAYSASGRQQPSDSTRVSQLAAELERAQRVLRELIALDAEAYESLTTASRRAKQDPSAEPAHQDALHAAAAVPMQMAAVASSTLAVMDDLKNLASRYLLSDLAIAAILAEAIARAAHYTVQINARQLHDVERRTRLMSDIGEVLRHCALRRDSIEAFVRGHLEQPAPRGR